MIEIMAIVLAVITAAGGIAKVIHECYTSRDMQQQIIIRNQDKNRESIEDMVMEQFKHNDQQMDRDINIQINVRNHNHEEKEEND